MPLGYLSSISSWKVPPRVMPVVTGCPFGPGNQRCPILMTLSFKCHSLQEEPPILWLSNSKRN